MPAISPFAVEAPGGVKPPPETPGPEWYAHTGNRALDPFLAGRSPEGSAAFLLPWLRPGLDLLDCGCAFGAITRGFVPCVAPGRVAGVDADAGQIARARLLNAGVAHPPEFRVASVYALPFPDAAFDVVYAGQLLWHLRQPARALREMWRVLRPGGLVAVFDARVGRTIWTPETPGLRALLEWEERALRRQGAAVDHGNDLPARLAEAGFEQVRAGVTPYRAVGPAAAGGLLDYFRARFEAPRVVETILGAGWADRAALDAALAEIPAWAAQPAATFIEESVWALGRVPEA